MRQPLPFILTAGLLTVWAGPAPAQTAGGEALTLAQATTLALGVSPSVAIAEQGLAQARARSGQAQAQRGFQITFNSTASLSNGAVYQGPPTQETFGSLQNTLTVPLPFSPRLSALQRQAQSQTEAATASLARPWPQKAGANR